MIASLLPWLSPFAVTMVLCATVKLFGSDGFKQEYSWPQVLATALQLGAIWVLFSLVMSVVCG